jgi:uncharacterized protein
MNDKIHERSTRIRTIWPERTQPLVATLHAPPLPGSPRYDGDWQRVERQVFADADAYLEQDVDGIILENFGDSPFYPQSVPPITLTCLTALATWLRERSPKPLGINLLRNDAVGALAIARAVDAQFIRVNVLCGARLADQGILAGNAHDVLRKRREWDAERIAILADVQVKHSAPLAARPLSEEVTETLERGGADGIILTGTATGEATALRDLQLATEITGRDRVWVGSGVVPEQIPELRALAGGLIVGSYCKQDGIVTKPVDGRRVAELVAALRG